MTMDEFLKKYFGCKRPFREYAKRVINEFGEEEYEYLTKSGFKAYGQFVHMLYDLSSLCEQTGMTGFVNPDNVNSAVDCFDELVSTYHF